MEKTKKEQKKTLTENLKDPIYVSYNILLKLEEIKRVLYAMLEIQNNLYQRVLAEEAPAEPEPSPQKPIEKNKEEKEGVFKNK